MTDPRGEITAVHRIYLDVPADGPPGKRRGTDAPKQMLGKPAGSGVRARASTRSSKATRREARSGASATSSRRTITPPAASRRAPVRTEPPARR